MIAPASTALTSEAQPVHSVQHAHLVITSARLSIIPTVAIMCSNCRPINDNNVGRVDADGSVIVVANVTDDRAEFEVTEEV